MGSGFTRGTLSSIVSKNNMADITIFIYVLLSGSLRNMPTAQHGLVVVVLVLNIDPKPYRNAWWHHLIVRKSCSKRSSFTV